VAHAKPTSLERYPFMTLDSLDFFRLFDASPNAYMAVDRELRYVAANRAYLQTTQSRLEDLLGQPVFKVFPNDPANPNNAAQRMLKESFERVLAEGRPDAIALIPYRMPRATAEGMQLEQRYWSASHLPVFDEHGQVELILQHTVDVTELQELRQSSGSGPFSDAGSGTITRLEADLLGRVRRVQRTNISLEAERKHLRRLFEQAPGFVCVLRGKEHIFELANRSYLQMVGRTDIIGLPVSDALPEVVGQGFVELLDNVLATGEPFVGRDVSIRLQREFGGALEQCYLDFVYQPIFEADGSVSGIFVQGNDTTAQRRAQDELDRHRDHLEELVKERTRELERSETERREAEAQLRQAQKMEAVGNLTGGVAHDFNNLLQVIGGNLQLLRGDVPQTKRAERRLSTAVGAVQRGAKLAAQLLAFARRQPLEPQPLHLGRVLRDMRDLLTRAVGEDVAIETVVQKDLWNTYADPNQIDNVVLNLVLNARDAMKGAGKLTLALDNALLGADDPDLPTDVAAGQYVRLSVTDNGAGMSPEVIERAFEPFFTTKPDGHGTGLGLSMVYGFVKQSGGHIQIQSRVQHGTTLEIFLPRTLAAEVQTPRSKAQTIEGGHETILVVEDDPDVRQTVVELLAELGYHLLQAHDAVSALAVLQSGVRVDLLFTDVVMPGPMRSRELAARAKALSPELCVLFTSGYTQDVIVHEGRLDADVSLLSKPYSREDLARKVRLAFEQHKPRSSHPPGEAAPVQVDAPGEPAGIDTRRVLVVEDDDDIRDLVQELLEQRGHQVRAVASAESAEAALREQTFDVLFTDVSLPGMSGIELSRRARAHTPTLKVVIATGHGAASLLDAATVLADAVLLSKPFEEADVLRAIEVS
jgi:signal transduction histidine kinase/DNA-binding response OmpR family regulator